jgi:putative addiction module component (TIGR02574 family)
MIYICFMSIQLEDILKLSVPERILWAEALWSSIVSEKNSGEQIAVSVEHKKILDKELSAYKKDPAIGSSWKDVKARIRTK